MGQQKYKMKRKKCIVFQSTFHPGRALYESCFILSFPKGPESLTLLITASHMGSKDPCYGLPGAPSPQTGLGCVQPGEEGYSCFYLSLRCCSSKVSSMLIAIVLCLVHKPKLSCCNVRNSSHTGQPETQPELIAKGELENQFRSFAQNLPAPCPPSGVSSLPLCAGLAASHPQTATQMSPCWKAPP